MTGRDKLIEIKEQWKQKVYLRDEVKNDFPFQLKETEEFFIPLGWILTNDIPCYVICDYTPVINFSKDGYVITFVKKDNEWILRYISKKVMNLQEEMEMYDIYTKKRIYSEVIQNSGSILSYGIYNFQGELTRFGWEENNSHHAEFSYKNGLITLL